MAAVRAELTPKVRRIATNVARRICSPVGRYGTLIFARNAITPLRAFHALRMAETDLLEIGATLPRTIRLVRKVSSSELSVCCTALGIGHDDFKSSGRS